MPHEIFYGCLGGAVEEVEGDEGLRESACQPAVKFIHVAVRTSQRPASRRKRSNSDTRSDIGKRRTEGHGVDEAVPHAELGVGLRSRHQRGRPAESRSRGRVIP